MHRYFFDFSDETDTHTDTEGSEFGNETAAEEEAAGMLLEVTRDHFHYGRSLLTVAVRDQTGRVLSNVSLSLEIRRAERLVR
ncbi:DUF6894 family protein [Devosia sp. A16]|uniref:DUF6894 family protein n=1 Tax=Devosia sp. A16 TaxID=1736675 RepID=UPI003FA4D4F4